MIKLRSTVPFRLSSLLHVKSALPYVTVAPQHKCISLFIEDDRALLEVIGSKICHSPSILTKNAGTKHHEFDNSDDIEDLNNRTQSTNVK
ncbi:hypothetical protein LTR56_026381, partial [Elasticomyces elasticus]